MTKSKYTYWKKGCGDVYRQGKNTVLLNRWSFVQGEWGSLGFYYQFESLNGRRRISADTARKMGVVI